MINRASRKYMIVIFYCTKKLEAASKVFIDITDIIFHGLRRTWYFWNKILNTHNIWFDGAIKTKKTN
jgi:hypothetical protein